MSRAFPPPPTGMIIVMRFENGVTGMMGCDEVVSAGRCTRTHGGGNSITVVVGGIGFCVYYFYHYYNYT